ncbi:MAG TPA: trigger factor, partial [Pyrinomonadaceae bacterium]|nr:trigger factor [Pyrinomonadaceae bacterium]
EEVERVIHDLREASAALQPVEDRGAQAGDTVTSDFRGVYVEPAGGEDINVEDVEVVLGGEGVVEEFTENLSGAREGDARTFRVKYPEDFKAQGLAGKEIEYTATVTAVRRKELPELDDEWVQTLGEEGVETVEQLRARVRENLQSHARFESDQRVRGEVMGKLIEAHQFEVPESLVNYQTRELLQGAVRDMMRRGMDPRQQQIDWEQMGALFRPQAEADLRGSLLLERVADAEGIEVSDEEIEEEIESVARASRKTADEVRAALTKQGGERSIADRLRHRKALDFIVDSATVRDEEWREDEPARAAEDEQGDTQPGESPTSAAAEQG